MTLQKIKDWGVKGSRSSRTARAEPGDRQVPEVARAVGGIDYVVERRDNHSDWDKITVDDWNNLRETNLRVTWVVTPRAQQMIRKVTARDRLHETISGSRLALQTAYCATKAVFDVGQGLRAVRCPGIGFNAATGWVSPNGGAMSMKRMRSSTTGADRSQSARGGAEELAATIASSSDDADYVPRQR